MDTPFEHKKSPEELREALERQIRHLRRSNRTYDEGDLEEAERIAAALYVLFADYASNKALTRVTKVRAHLRFPDSRNWTGKPDPRSLWVGPPLCSVGHQGSYVPPLAPAEHQVPYPLVQFQRWWDTVAFTTHKGRKLTRKNLVFRLRNEDGGGHVDKSLKSEAYHDLKYQGDIHFAVTDGAAFVVFINNPSFGRGPFDIRFRGHFEAGSRASLATSMVWPPPPDAKPLKNAHWATMRQMGWEADQAFIALGL